MADGNIADMEISQHIAALEKDGVLLADTAADAGLKARVPGCPGWRVRDLVRHQAYVHRWAMRHILERPAQVIDDHHSEADVLSGGPPDSELLAAYREGHASLVRTLREADPGIQCGTFLPAPSPLAFWARRQAHETAIHRFDAQTALGDLRPSPRAAFAPEFAADGIDELIMGLAASQKGDGTPRELLVRTPDTKDAWRFAWPAEGPVQTRRYRPDEEPGAADCILTGLASSVYLFLWNRCTAAEADIEITGDSDVVRAWNSSVRVRWA